VEHLASLEKLLDLHLRSTKVTAAGVAKLQQANPRCRIEWDGGVIEPQPSADSGSSPNFALQLDGVDDHIEIPTLQYDGTHPLTIEAWVTPQSLHRVIVGNGPLTLGVLHDAPNWFFDIGPSLGHYVQSVEPAQRQKRTHIAAVIDGQQGRLYVDGVQQNSGCGTPSSGIPAGKNGFFFGCACDKDRNPRALNRFFQGTIDEIRVSSVPRYANDAGNVTPSARFNPDEHTLALYHFDEGQGNVLHDASGHGHDGKIIGATWVKQTPAGSPLSTAADRRAAEWVLSVGGSVRGVPDPGRLITSADAIPSGEWKLTMANVTGKSQATDAALKVFEGCRHLNGLYLASTPVTDSGLAVFKDCKELLVLDLDRTEVTDAGLAVFRDCHSLEQLALTSTRVSDPGLAAFGGCKKLFRLLLSNTSVGDTGVAAFEDCQKLKILGLKKTRVTKDGVKRLASALPKCRIEWDGGVVEPRAE